MPLSKLAKRPLTSYRLGVRSLIVTENVTVDGVIDLAAGWFDPLAEDVDQSDITAANAEHREAADDHARGTLTEPGLCALSLSTVRP